VNEWARPRQAGVRPIEAEGWENHLRSRLSNRTGDTDQVGTCIGAYRLESESTEDQGLAIGGSRTRAEGVLHPKKVGPPPLDQQLQIEPSEVLFPRQR